MKASSFKGDIKPLDTRGQTFKNALVYIGNIYDKHDDRKWLRLGTEIRAYDLFRRMLVKQKSRRDQGKGQSGILRTEHIIEP